MSYEILHSVDC